MARSVVWQIVACSATGSWAGIFVASDLRHLSARQLAASAGNGVSAWIWIERYLRGETERL